MQTWFWRSLTIALLTLVVSCASFDYEPVKPVRISDDFFGICPANGNPSHAELQVIDQAGGIWIRQGFFWSSIQSRADRWDWTAPDAYVAMAQSHHKKILAVLDYDVDWLLPTANRRPYISPADLPKFLNYVRQTVQRYQGKVAAWEIWNEPNNPQFWGGSLQEFIQLHIAVARAIRESDPQATIIGGAFSLVPEDWVRAMFEQGAFAQVDGISCHPYWLTPDSVLAMVANLQRIARSYGFTGQIWLTEFGFPTGGWYPSATSLNGQSDYLVKTLVGAALHEVHTLCWYILADYYKPVEGPVLFDSEKFFGLVHNDFSPKPGFYAYRALVDGVANSTYQPELVRVSPGLTPLLVALPFLKDDGSLSLLLWSRLGDRLSIKLSGTPGIAESSLYEAARSQPAPGDSLSIELTSSPRLFRLSADQVPAISNRILAITRIL